MIEDGRLSSTSCENSDTYWELELSPSWPELVKLDAPLKMRSAYQMVGTSARRWDLEKKIFGGHRFIQDMTLPGMMHGRVVRFPNQAATVVTIEEAGFKQRFPEVILVRNGSFLGVISAREEVCIAAAADLAKRVKWNIPPSLPDMGDLGSFLSGARSESQVVAEVGPAIDSGSSVRLESSYLRPYIAHASIGPSCALAHWRDLGVEIWTHSQSIYNLKADIEVYLQTVQADSTVPDVTVHHVEGSGCYGHNPADDVAFDALLLAQSVPGRPVRLLWSRADELSCGPLGPAHLVKISANICPDGTVSNWAHASWSNGYTSRPGRPDRRLSFSAASQVAPSFELPVSTDPPIKAGGGGDRNSVPLYDFPSLTIVSNRLLEMPIRASAIRGLGAYANVFAIESFMDELAHAIGKDPVSFRLQHLKDERAREVIRKVIEQAPWWNRRKDIDGLGQGLAVARYKGTGAWCAVAVQILAEEAVRVLQISIAADVGLVINPDGVRNQLEGGAVQSCSWTLKEEVSFTREEISTRSWSDYPILQFSEAPVLKVSIIDRPDEPSLGAGEAAQGPTAAAIGNAVFDALGIRIRKLPLTPQRILEAASTS